MAHFKSNVLRVLVTLYLGLIVTVLLNAQNSDTLLHRIPEVELKTLDNRIIGSSTLTNGDKPLVLIFWKSCCAPNIKMLDAISEVYEEWQEKTGVVIYAISTDDSRSSVGVAPLVNGKGWEFIVLLDVNSDFKRAMNVNDTPHIFILDAKNKVIWQKANYIPGDESEIYGILLNFRK